MDTLLEKLWDYVAEDKSQTMRVRLFRLMCLATAIVCLFFVLPSNLFEPGVPLEVNLLVIASGLFAIFCYSQSCHGKSRIMLFQFILVSVLDAVWFLNGGITGSVTYYFFAVLMFPLVMCHGRTRWIFSAFIVLDVCSLFLIEYYFPASVVRIHVRSGWFLDNLTGLICSFVAILLVVWVIVTNYDWEHRLLSRYAKELAASEENYRGVVENAMSIILRLDVEGRIVFFNKFAEDLFGYRREEIIGRPALGTILPPSSARGENLAAKFDDLLKHPEKHALAENENVCRDGRRIWVTWTNQPIYDEQGRLREILCVGADVTERAALQERLQLTQFTMDAAAEQIIWTDERGKIIYVNAATVSELGYSAAELLALALHDLATDFPADEWDKYWQIFKRDRAATFELTQRRKNGSTRPVELSLTYIKVADKEYTTIFIRDLTGRKRAEAKRRQHEQQMLHLQRLESLGILAGGIAHDFNNLLAAILGNISLVQLGLPSGSENYELLGEAEKASLQAKGLTAQLLTFSKGGKPVKSAVNIGSIIRDSTSLALRGKPVKCLIHIPDHLPLVEADPTQLTQVFNNLVINSCQAMPHGGQIAIRAHSRTIYQSNHLLMTGGEYVEVVVQDQGGGIAPEHLSKIFDPYFTTKETGTGLGLAVVHSIIKHHQGAVSVESQPGKGTAFTLLLPVSKQSPPAVSEVEPPAGQRGCRILVMDDEVALLRLLSKLLGKLGYQVETATDGSATLQLYQQAVAQQKPFDLLIMDLTIPGGMGGLETIRRLREIDPHVRAIVSSGYSQDPVLADHQAYGFKGAIHKPFTAEQVKTAVHKVLAR